MPNNLGASDLIGVEDESIPHAAATIITRFYIIADKVDTAIGVSCMDPTVLPAGRGSGAPSLRCVAAGGQRRFQSVVPARYWDSPLGRKRYAKRRPADEAKLLEEIRRIARKRPRFGSPWIHDALGKRGWSVNHKWVARLWREDRIQVPKKHHKKRRSPCGASEHSCIRKGALRPNHIWSYDFVEDRTEHNRKLRMLVVIDEFTRESLAIEVAWSFTAAQVVEVLGYLFAVRGVRGAYQQRPRP